GRRRPQPPPGEQNIVPRHLADIGAIRTRWQHATGPVPPQRPRPAPTTRAGPPTTTAARAARAARAT
ncbi:hypothetical protein ACFZDJ_54540, partial [Streptomyces sp. NPDC007896]